MKLIIKGKLPNLNDYTYACRGYRGNVMGARMKKDCEALISWHIKQSKLKKVDKPVRLQFVWYEPNKRRDKDNVSAFGRKVILDALVKNNILEDDGWKYIVGFSDDFYVDKENPRIEVEINEEGSML